MGTHAKLFKSAGNLNLHGKLKYRLAIFLRHASIVYESSERKFKEKGSSQWLQDTRGAVAGKQGSVGQDCKVIELTRGNDYTTQ